MRGERLSASIQKNAYQITDQYTHTVWPRIVVSSKRENIFRNIEMWNLKVQACKIASKTYKDNIMYTDMNTCTFINIEANV